MTDSVINFAIVGYGNIGKRHAQYILSNKKSRLISVCDIRENAADDFLKKNKILFYKKIEEVLSDDKIDAVSVCVPNYLHKKITIQSLLSQKNVVCEKPMAMNVKECDEMIRAAEKMKKKIFVVKQNRYNPPIRELKKLIDENLLGKIYQVVINCFWNRNEQYYRQSEWRGKKKKDGGCLFTQFSHFVDNMYYLFGDAEPQSAVFRNYNHKNSVQFEDSGMIQLVNKHGAMISFNFSINSFEKNYEGSITVIGENGTIKIGGQYLNTIEYARIKNYSVPKIFVQGKNNDYGFYEGSMSNHDKMIQNVIDTLNGKAVETTNANEGRKVVEIIQKMYSARK